MSAKRHYEIGKRHHEGQFVGWAVWKVHEACTRTCCPVTVAEFYGPKARTHALWFKANLEREKSNG